MQDLAIDSIHVYESTPPGTDPRPPLRFIQLDDEMAVVPTQFVAVLRREDGVSIAVEMFIDADLEPEVKEIRTWNRHGDPLDVRDLPAISVGDLEKIIKRASSRWHIIMHQEDDTTEAHVERLGHSLSSLPTDPNRHSFRLTDFGITRSWTLDPDDLNHDAADRIISTMRQRRGRKGRRRGPDESDLASVVELREDARLTYKAIGERKGIDESTAHRWYRKAKEQGL